jgi:hypothetical protein
MHAKRAPIQPEFIEFPVLIAIRPEPVSRVIVPLIRKAHLNAVSPEHPKFLDQTIQFFGPLAFQEGDNFLSSVESRGYTRQRLFRDRAYSNCLPPGVTF